VGREEEDLGNRASQRAGESSVIETCKCSGVYFQAMLCPRPRSNGV